MSRLQRWCIDVTNEDDDKHIVNGHEVRLYAMWHTKPSHVPEHMKDWEPDKWVVVVRDIFTPERNFEFWYDHLFVARISKKKGIDYVRGLIYRKVLVQIAKRVVKRSEISHSRGTGTGMGKARERERIAPTKGTNLTAISNRTRVLKLGRRRKYNQDLLAQVDERLAKLIKEVK
jgi:hypothetical protein